LAPGDVAFQNSRISNGSDPHKSDADADPTYHPDADPDADPIFHPDADPDPTFRLMRIRILLFLWVSGAGQSGTYFNRFFNKLFNLTKYLFLNMKRFMRIRIPISLLCGSGS
jgi:hypothetical protein